MLDRLPSQGIINIYKSHMCVYLYMYMYICVYLNKCQYVYRWYEADKKSHVWTLALDRLPIQGIIDIYKSYMCVYTYICVYVYIK